MRLCWSFINSDLLFAEKKFEKKCLRGVLTWQHRCQTPTSLKSACLMPCGRQQLLSSGFPRLRFCMKFAATSYHGTLARSSAIELLSLQNAVLPALHHSLAADCCACAQRICECARFLSATNMPNAKRRKAPLATDMLPIAEVARRPSCKANSCRPRST